MKNEFIKNLERCTVAGCSHCDRCSEIKIDRRERQEIEINDSLYNKEVEQYYFYFLENKAS